MIPNDFIGAPWSGAIRRVVIPRWALTGVTNSNRRSIFNAPLMHVRGIELRKGVLIRNVALAVLILSTVLGCAGRPSPVPLVGTTQDIAALAGAWVGEYASAASGRSGSITFTLRAAGDSAFGDVVMVPVGLNHPLTPWRDVSAVQVREQPEVLTINFVRVRAGHVNGTLAPYADPATGARLVTSFDGTLSGNTIDGTYTTHLPSGETQTGRWRVQRR